MCSCSKYVIFYSNCIISLYGEKKKEYERPDKAEIWLYVCVNVLAYKFINCALPGINISTKHTANDVTQMGNIVDIGQGTSYQHILFSSHRYTVREWQLYEHISLQDCFEKSSLE